MADKTIKDVVKQLEIVNEGLQEQRDQGDQLIGFESSSGILGKIARSQRIKAEKDAQAEGREHTRQFDEQLDNLTNLHVETSEVRAGVEAQIAPIESQVALAETIVDQTIPIATLVDQGETQIEAAQDAAASAAEAAREAARAGDGDGPEVAVKLEVEEGGKGLFAKMGLGKLLMSFGGWIFAGLSTAIAWLGAQFGPGLLLKLKAFTPWGLALTALTMAIVDGFAGWTKSEEWGVSSISGFIGGFLGGDKSGWEGAFANAGKWAIAGVAAGFPFGPPGMIAGGLIGAAIGGLLGYIGGAKIAGAVDGMGAWFYKQFMDLVIGPIKAVWDFIAPDWAKAVTDKMVWSDLLPPGLAKLFNGEYFTFDMPEFTWTDIFPKFLVDLFTNVTKVVGATTWSWMDLLPPFLTKFFTGAYAPGKEEFEWKDLVPEFIWKVAEVAKTAWADTPFTWRSLVPTFILKIIDGFTDQPGEFSWMDLVPKFISDLVAAGTAEATKTGPFSWKALLPDWMIGAWDSTRGLALQAGKFDWRPLLPGFITDFFPGDGPMTIAGGASAVGAFDWRNLLPKFITDLFPTDGPLTINAGIAAVGAWDWMSLVPKFIQDFIADPVKLAGQESFDWKSLLPPFIRDFFGDKKLDSAMAQVKAFDWKSLLPSFIVSIIDGEPLLDVAKTFTWKSLLPQFIVDIIDGTGQAAEEGSLTSSIGEMFSNIAAAIKARMVAIIDSIADVVPGMTSSAEAAREKIEAMGGFEGNVIGSSDIDIDKLTKALAAGQIAQEDIAGLMKDQADDLKKADLDKLAELAGSAAKGLSLKTFEGGDLVKYATGGPVKTTGPAHLTAGEMVLDEKVGTLVTKAAESLSGQNLMNLQRDKATAGGMAATMIVNNTNSQQINQSTAMALPASPIMAGNQESTLSTA